MKLWATLTNAFHGWVLIVRGDAAWREQFAISRAGLVTAVLIFFFFAFLAVAFASAAIGMPGASGVATALMVQGLWLLALLIAILATRKFLRSSEPILELMVPGTYAMIGYLLVGSFAAMIGDVALLALWAALGYLLFLLARVATDWSRGVSAAFAVLTIALLVGLPATLYMLAIAVSPST